jgi:hypothetical protein
MNGSHHHLSSTLMAVPISKFLKQSTVSFYLGCTIAQAVSCWLPTSVAWVRSRVWSSWICGGQSGSGAGFLRVLQFPLPIFIPPITPQSPSPIIWGWYNRPEVATIQGTYSHPTSNKRKSFYLNLFWGFRMVLKLPGSNLMVRSCIQVHQLYQLVFWSLDV